MKDLKHMIYFEHLLQDANNELVRQEKEEGKHPLAYTCFHVPEVLLNLEGCFSVRLRAPNMGSTEIATYYMANSACEYSRALLERSIEGNYKFIDALIGVDVCEPMNRCMENMEILKIHEEKNEQFFRCYLDIPYSDDEDCAIHLAEQVSRKVLKQLEKNYQIDVSDHAIRKAVAEFNEMCRIIQEMGDLRKADHPVITGSEFHKIVLCTYVCPKNKILPYLVETLEELKHREPDKKNHYKSRVVVVGSEIDDPGMIELIEESGALVVADRFCYGSIPGRSEIILNDEEDALIQIVRKNLLDTECPRQCAEHKMKYRKDHVKELVEEYHADGAIYEQMKFCTYWSYERTLASHIMPAEYDVPVLSIDRPYRSAGSGQLRTRVQAFVESLEIKKIKAERQKKEQAGEVK